MKKAFLLFWYLASNFFVNGMTTPSPLDEFGSEVNPPELKRKKKTSPKDLGVVGLVQKNPDVQSSKKTVSKVCETIVRKQLKKAVDNEDYKKVRDLCSQGDLSRLFLDSCWHQNSFLYAACKNILGMVILFCDLRCAAVDDVSCSGMSALHYAASNLNYEMINVLCRFGIDVNLRNKQGFTPLHCLMMPNVYKQEEDKFFARERGAELLLHYGADKWLCDNTLVDGSFNEKCPPRFYAPSGTYVEEILEIDLEACPFCSNSNNKDLGLDVGPCLFRNDTASIPVIYEYESLLIPKRP